MKKKYLKVYQEYYDYVDEQIVLCEVCGQIAADVHHIRYRSHQGDDDIVNLIGLCRTCHDKAHGKREPAYSKEYLQKIHNKNL